MNDFILQQRYGERLAQRTICQVIDLGGKSRNSFVASLCALARATTDRGDRFVVAGTEIPGAAWPGALLETDTEVFLSTSRTEILRYVASLNADIVHSHFSSYDIGASLFTPKSRLFWHIHTARDASTASIVRKIRAFIKTRIFGARVEAFVVPSQGMKREQSSWFVPQNKIRVILNAIDSAYFRPPTETERALARQRLDLSSTDNVVLFLERIPLKGGATLRAALHMVPQLRLLVVGGTKSMRDEFGSFPRVLSLDYTSEIRQLYWAADVLAFPSLREGLPYTVIEALGCNLPVVASDIAPVLEVAEKIRGIEIFRRDDPAMLAAALVRSCNRGRIDTATKTAAAFGLDRWVDEMLGLYR